MGSTERAAELGDRRWRDLLQAHHALARHELARHHGRELNMTGDGFLATFDAPERALRCACSLRDAVRRLGLEIRAGLHHGEVEIVGGTVGGIGVHIGARVGARAGAGEVLVSSTVRDVAAGSGFEFEDRGSHALKGVPGDWRLFAVVGEPLRLPVSTLSDRVREARLPRVLAVYLAACAGVLWLTAYLQGRFALPLWTLPLAIVLLAIGLVVLAATAWVQAQPLTALRAQREEVPGSWELDLRDVGRSVARGRLPHLTWGRSLLGGVMAFSLLFGLAGLYVVVQDRGRSFGPTSAVAETAGPGIAVLPFAVRGPGIDVWREGMVDVLSTNLDGVAGLRAIKSRTVLARWRESVRGSDAPDFEGSLEIARRTGARYALIGDALATGSDVRFAAEVYDLESGRSLGRGEVLGVPDSVIAMVDRLSIEVLRAILGGRESELPRVDLAAVTTTSLPALRAYVEGEAHYRRGDFERASAAYERAVGVDSMFALAFSSLADAYGWLDRIGNDLSLRTSERAARLAHRLPEREAIIVRARLALERGTLDGLEALRQAVRRYPEDPVVWFLLGDTYVHLGSQALADPEEARRAMTRAVELDPTFAPYYIHLVEASFHDADARRAAELVETYGRLAPGSIYDVADHLALALAFGDSTARAQAFSALDTLDREPFERLSTGAYLKHPRRSPVAAEVLTRLRSRRDATPIAAGARFNVDLARGKLRSALEDVDDPLLADRSRESLYRLHLAGLPVPQVRLERGLSLGGVDSTDVLETFYAAAYAAERGRWSEHAAGLARIAEEGRRLLGAGDTTGARVTEGVALALEGHGLRNRGRIEAAAPMLERAQRQATGGDRRRRVLNQVLRWWLGDVFLETDRAREAERYFASLYEDVYARESAVPAAERLGRVYEALGQLDKAREAYEYFALAWHDADSELQPRVREARAAALRLAGPRRE